MPSLHLSFCPLYNVLIGCQVTSYYYTLSPENELKTGKLYLANTQRVIEGFNEILAVETGK